MSAAPLARRRCHVCGVTFKPPHANTWRCRVHRNKGAGSTGHIIGTRACVVCGTMFDVHFAGTRKVCGADACALDLKARSRANHYAAKKARRRARAARADRAARQPPAALPPDVRADLERAKARRDARLAAVLAEARAELALAFQPISVQGADPTDVSPAHWDAA